jgi:RNA polymerase sigma-70 factor (ECF subfamily)
MDGCFHESSPTGDGGSTMSPMLAWSAILSAELQEERAATVPDRAALDRVVRAAQGGDREAFGELYGRFGRYVHGVLLASADRQDVRDLVHDVFVQALARLGTLREPAAFGPWVAQIARNTAKMQRRGARKLEPLDEAARAAPHPAQPSPDGEVVLRAIQSMPETYREPLILRLVEGMSGAEIAERTGMTPGSVRVNLHRGMTQLREKLGVQP